MIRRHLFCVALLGLLAQGTFAATPVEGKDYLVLKPTASTVADKIEVVDFFAYTCGHCLRFNPLIDAWEKKAPTDVKLVKSPVAWDASGEFLARIYFTFEALGRVKDLHPVFWQDIMAGAITNSNALIDWLNQHNVNLTEWNTAYESFGVKMQTQQASQRWQAYRLEATPYIGVAGKYLTAPHMTGSREKTIDVLNWLVAKERRERQAR